MSDFYQILGVARDASQDDIKKAYRKLALQLHPDKNREDSPAEANRKFEKLSKAYEVLSNADSRDQYDMQSSSSGRRGARQDDFASRNPFEIFQEFFGVQSPFSMRHTEIFSPSLFSFGGEISSSPDSLPDVSIPGVSTRVRYRRLTSTKTFSNGKMMETRTSSLNGNEVVEVFEDGILKKRIVNGIRQALPSTSNSSK